MANRGETTPQPEEPAPARPDGPQPGPGLPDWLEDEEELGAAPTDFRRNIWLLLAILGAVLAAWLAGRLEKSLAEHRARAAAPSRSHAAVLGPGPRSGSWAR